MSLIPSIAYDYYFSVVFLLAIHLALLGISIYLTRPRYAAAIVFIVLSLLMDAPERHATVLLKAMGDAVLFAHADRQALYFFATLCNNIISAVGLAFSVWALKASPKTGRWLWYLLIFFKFLTQPSVNYPEPSPSN
jgi:hypothetical protein